ncbi:putative recombinase [Oscillibacter valericigenes Sjm18-20]|nr:putative recombinase [Oscillibacter valericigenes Sjm18-20]
MSNGKIIPLYERLSRDDEPQGESNSISHQKQMLEEHARKNSFPRPTHFTDDGISGTRFDRPVFTGMMEEVEAGYVEVVIVKGMSRLERDCLKGSQEHGDSAAEKHSVDCRKRRCGQRPKR